MKFTLNPTKCWCHRRPWWPVSVSDAVAVGGAEIDSGLRGKKFRTSLFWSLLGSFFEVGMFVLKSSSGCVILKEF